VSVTRRLSAALLAVLLCLAVIGTSTASATWFNWYNGVVGPGGMRFEGINHNTYATENDQTGPNPCTGVDPVYLICTAGTPVAHFGYALGDPDGGNHDAVSHYDHLWWCNGSC
jgi:hypothetical protein